MNTVPPALKLFIGRDRAPAPRLTPVRPCWHRAPARRTEPTALVRTIMAAWRLFGKDVTAEQLPAELRSMLAQMQRERVALEALTNAARGAAQHETQPPQAIADA